MTRFWVSRFWRGKPSPAEAGQQDAEHGHHLVEFEDADLLRLTGRVLEDVEFVGEAEADREQGCEHPGLEETETVADDHGFDL